MIKEIIRKTLLLTAIMILAVYFVSYLKIGTTQEIVLVFELFLLSSFITLIQQLLKKIVFSNFLHHFTTFLKK